MGKCECYIHSLKQGEKHVLGEARIIKRLGDNDYLAEYNGVRCHAIFNPFAGVLCGRCVRDRSQVPGRPHPIKMAARDRLCACLLLPGKENAI